MAQVGKALTEAQTREYVAATDAGLPAPKGLEHVTFRNVDGHAGYFFAGDDAEAIDAAHRAEAKAADDRAALDAKVRKAAAAAGVDPTPAPAPSGG